MNLCLTKSYPSFKPQLDITWSILLLLGDALLPSREVCATCWLGHRQYFPLTPDLQIAISGCVFQTLDGGQPQFQVIYTPSKMGVSPLRAGTSFLGPLALGGAVCLQQHLRLSRRQSC